MPPPIKRRKVTRQEPRPEELTFDPSARQEYLSGFHKRKQARKHNARETAVKRDKEERVIARKQLRDQRKEDLVRHVEAVNIEVKKQSAILNGIDSDADEDGTDAEGADGAKKAAVKTAEQAAEDEAEYVDEDKYTTVTVEAMGESDHEQTDAEDERKADEAQAEARKQAAKKKKPWQTGTKPKTKKFRYETKAERSITRQKQKSKNRSAANARKTGNG